MREVLIVGAGLIGYKRANSLSANLNLFGVMDIDSKKADQFSSFYNCANFSNLDTALKSLPVGSLVIIAVRHCDLAEIAQKALKMKFHILIEKPGSINSKEMLELIEHANNSGTTISIGYNHRFHGAAIELKKLVDSGIYGEVQLIRARYGHGGRPGYEKEWRADYRLSGGGELLDQGCHLLDLLNYIDTKPSLEFAMLPTLYWEIGVEDNAFLAGNILNSGKFWIHASWTEWKNLFSFEVFLKIAKIEWNGLNGSYGPEKLIIHHMEKGLGIPKETVIEFPANDNSWALEMLEVENRINGKHSKSASGESGLKVLELIDEAYAR